MANSTQIRPEKNSEPLIVYDNLMVALINKNIFLPITEFAYEHLARTLIKNIVEIENTNMIENNNIIDIRESSIEKEILEILLKDHTTSTPEIQHNIFWATKDYEYLGEGFQEKDEIRYEHICDNSIIVPRVLKSKNQQTNRSKEMAEVFTPSWICNAQNNLIDDAWFGRKGVFNTEHANLDGTHTWTANPDKIVFPEDKKWQDYVRENRLEITCGEAPYLVSRYDTTTGEAIPIANRIGLLDRKLRVVNENTETTGEWLNAAQDAFKSIYGYEWQGDNLLLARESLLYTFQEYYQYKFDKLPLTSSLKYIAYIISWNLWQMDGLKCVVPYSCQDIITFGLFGEETVTPCKGCQTEGYHYHNGKYCLVKDWRAKDPETKKLGRKYRFMDWIK